jgi:hypothetical protein
MKNFSLQGYLSNSFIIIRLHPYGRSKHQLPLLLHQFLITIITMLLLFFTRKMEHLRSASGQPGLVYGKTELIMLTAKN